MEDRWSTSATVDVARRRLGAAFRAAGARDCGGTDTDLELEVGNEGRLRLRGQEFTVMEDFPVHIRIALEPVDGGTQVRVRQVDPFEATARPDLHAKYQMAMRHWSGHARAALEDARR